MVSFGREQGAALHPPKAEGLRRVQRPGYGMLARNVQCPSGHCTFLASGCQRRLAGLGEIEGKGWRRAGSNNVSISTSDLFLASSCHFACY